MEKIFRIMDVSDTKGVEFAAYQLKGVAYQWYMSVMGVRVKILHRQFRKIFLETFLITYFLRSLEKLRLRHL